MKTKTDTGHQVQGTAARTLAGTTVGFFFGFAAVALFSITVGAFKQAMELTPLMVGMLIAIPNLTGSLLRIPFGAWVDADGGRKPFLLLLILSLTGLALLLGFTVLYHDTGAIRQSHLPFLLFAGALSGCGIATFSVGIGQVSYWFPQKRQGTALGVYAGLGNLAPGLFSVALPAAVGLWGISGTYGVWIGILLAGIIAYHLLAGRAPYFQWLRSGVTSESAVAAARSLGQELFPADSAWQSIIIAARVWKTWVLVGIYFVTFGGFLALTGWLPTYWQEFHGLNLAAAGVFTGAYSILASLARVFGGSLADRFTGELALAGSLLVTLAGAVLLTFTAAFAWAFAGVLVMAVGMGIGNAAVFKLVPQTVKQAVGGAAGWVGGLGAAGGFAIPPVMAAFVHSGGVVGYATGFSVFIGLTLGGLAATWMLRERKVQPELGEAVFDTPSI